MKVIGVLWIIISGRLLLIAGSALSIRIATEVLGPIQAGIMNLILSITSLIALGIAPVGLFFNRHALEWYREGSLSLCTSRFIVFLTGAATAASCLVFGFHVLLPSVHIPSEIEWLILLLAMALIITTLNGSMLNILNLLGFRGSYVLLSNLAAWLGLLIATIITWVWGNRAELWLIGIFAGQAVTLLLSIILIFVSPTVSSCKDIRNRPDPTFGIGAVLRFSWPLTVCTALYWVQKDGYRLVMAYFTGMDMVGLFTMNFAVGMMIMSSFETLFREYYDPIYYQDIANSSYERKINAWNDYATAKFPAIVLLTLFVAEAGTFLSRILLSEEFHAASWVIVWGSITYGAVMVYASYLNLTFALLDNKILIRPNLYGAITVLVLMNILTPWSPLLGTAMSLTVAMIVTMVHTAYRLGQAHDIRIPLRRMAYAALLGSPLVIILEWTKHHWLIPTQAEAAAILIITGLYFGMSQYILARPWLYRVNNTEASVLVAYDS